MTFELFLLLHVGTLLAAQAWTPAARTPAVSPTPRSPNSPAALIEMPYVKPPHTPAHFRWPMVFRVSVDAGGRVVAVHNTQNQRDVGPYIDGIMRARFRPALEAGQPVADSVTLTLDIPSMRENPKRLIELERKRTPRAP
jgi:hypothetical protein